MDFESYKKALLTEAVDNQGIQDVLDKFYHSEIDAGAHGLFKRNVGNELSAAYAIRCHPHHVVVCGSAHLGFSATPNEKFGRSFSFETSDVDVAILLPELFDRWWLELADPKVVLGERQANIANDLLNGFINPQSVRDSTETGRKWWALFAVSLQVASAKFGEGSIAILSSCKTTTAYRSLEVARNCKVHECRDRMLEAMNRYSRSALDLRVAMRSETHGEVSAIDESRPSVTSSDRRTSARRIECI